MKKKKKILNEDTHPVIRAIGVSHTACKDEFFDKIFDLTAGVHFYFGNINTVRSTSYSASSVFIILKKLRREVWALPATPTFFFFLLHPINYPYTAV